MSLLRSRSSRVWWACLVVLLCVQVTLVHAQSSSSTGDAAIDCPDDLLDIDEADRCFCAQSSESFLINWDEFHWCTMAGRHWLSIITLLISGWFFFHLLLNTTDTYLVPVLEKLSEELHLSPNVAGVTLLAFGNGAPDTFSSISSFANGTGSIGVGAVVGSGVFVLTVVLGCVIINSRDGDFATYRRPFLRDVFFYTVGIIYLFVMFQDGKVYLAEAVTFMMWYFVYVVVVVLGRYIFQRMKRKKMGIPEVETTADTDSGPSSPKAGLAMGATGGAAKPAESSKTPLMSDHDPDIGEGEPANAWAIRVSAVTDASTPTGGSGSLKTPLVANAINSLTEEEKRRSVLGVNANLNVGDITRAGAEGHNVLSDYNLVRAKAKSVVKHSKKNFNTMFARKPRKTRTRAHALEDDHGPDSASAAPRFGGSAAGQARPAFGPGGGGGGNALGVPGMGSRDGNQGGGRPLAASMVVEEMPMSFFASPGASGGMLHGAGAAEDDEYMVVNKPGLDKAASGNQSSPAASKTGGGILSIGSTKEPAEDAKDEGGPTQRDSTFTVGDDEDEPKYCAPVVKAWRLLLFVADAPFILLRSLTIPQLDDPPEQDDTQDPRLQKSESMYDMTNVVEINPTFLSLSLFLALALLSWVISLKAEVWIPLLVMGSTMSVIFFKKCQQWELKTPASLFGKVRVRLNHRLQLTFLALAFIMSIVWVYVFASLLIELLQTTGDALGISPNILGLTVVAWGNSLGDFIADVVLAKKGHARMAAAGCVGSPCFSMLMGLGLGMTYKAASVYPEPFHLQWARNVPYTFVFLLMVIVCMTVTVSCITKFKFVRNYGYFLLGVYCLFLFVGLLGEAGVIHFSAMGYTGKEAG